MATSTTTRSHAAPGFVDLVRRRNVTWSAYPAPDRSWDLEVNGAYSHPAHDPRPWCPECQEVYDDLWSIAQHVIPKGDARKCTCAIVPFDGKLSFSPRRGERKEITLTIRILTKDNPGEELENPCLVEMERRLTELGARRE